jgi:enolase
VLGCITTSRA